MEPRYLRYFVAVGKELNITRAAQRMHTAQPSLSRQIRQLEEFVRSSLLLREGHLVDLTEAGRTLLTEARRILSMRMSAGPGSTAANQTSPQLPMN